jgi:DNA-binding MarR family transcriptional regulator
MKKADRSDRLVELLLERILTLVRREGRDLRLNQMAILLVCDAAEAPQTVRGLARYLEIEKPIVTRAVDRLEAVGLAKRKADPSDGRSVLIVPSPAGRRYCSRFASAAPARKKAPRGRA